MNVHYGIFIETIAGRFKSLQVALGRFNQQGLIYMYRLLCGIVCATLLCCALSSVEIPSGGTEIVAGKTLVFRSNGTPPAGTCSTIAVENTSFPQAYRVETLIAGNAWDIELKVPIDRAVKKGDVALLRFWLKAEVTRNEQSEADVNIYVQRSGEPWNKSTTFSANVGHVWSEYLVPYVFDDTYAAGGCEIGFGFGAAGPQTVAVGDVSMLYFGTSVALADLPRTTQTYAGREPDAEWRQQAAEQIDRLRKSDLVIVVRDAKGAAVPGAQVAVVMQRHTFPFGSAITGQAILGDSPDFKRYRQEFLANFNAAVVENDLKWAAYEGAWGDQFGKKTILPALRWLNDQHIKCRGHVMVWPSWRHSPDRLAELKNDPAGLETAVCQHIDTMGQDTQGLLDYWDVVNEPFDNHDITDVLGDASLATWFRRAKAVTDPRVRLYINDYGILSTGGAQGTGHQVHYEQTIAKLIHQGAPVEGIGMQAHFGSRVTPPAAVWAILDRFAAYGKPISITEFDVSTDDEALRADYTRDFLTACFAHPSVEAFITWGFWAGAHWRPDAAMFAKDWTLRANGEQWRKLIYHDWWTNETLTANDSGQAQLRGFHGDYEITVTVGTVTKKIQATIAAGKNQVICQFTP